MILFLCHIILSPRWNNKRLRSKAIVKFYLSCIFFTLGCAASIVWQQQQRQQQYDEDNDEDEARPFPLVLRLILAESGFDALLFGYHLRSPVVDASSFSAEDAARSVLDDVEVFPKDPNPPTLGNVPTNRASFEEFKASVRRRYTPTQGAPRH